MTPSDAERLPQERSTSPDGVTTIASPRPSSMGPSILDAKDGAFAEAGKVGVWTKADSVTEFDDLAAAAL
jgi:hypothetical protein